MNRPVRGQFDGGISNHHWTIYRSIGGCLTARPIRRTGEHASIDFNASRVPCACLVVILSERTRFPAEVTSIE